MVSMSDDEKFDMWLQDAAKEYNRPPAEVPRDEMWEAIRAGLAEGAGERPGDGSANVTPLPVRHRTVLPHRWQLAAATVLVAVGVAAGYWMRGPSGTAPAGQLSGRAPVAVDSTASPATTTATTTTTLDAALERHLTDAEALLVSYRGSPASDDKQVRDWAKDVLGTTRLMMDSPAATDPKRRALLQDLELILVQIVQMRDSARPDERDLIARSMAREQILTRLRTSIPAGAASGS
jgi:hypothetical protein